MKKAISLCVFLLTALLWTACADADLVLERRREQEHKVPAWGMRAYVDSFMGGKRAVAIISGSGQTCLGLYVFDEFGNCVAQDDLTSAKTSDDLAADWIPMQTARYEIEVRNAGYMFNTFDIALR